MESSWYVASSGFSRGCHTPSSAKSLVDTGVVVGRSLRPDLGIGARVSSATLFECEACNESASVNDKDRHHSAVAGAGGCLGRLAPVAVCCCSCGHTAGPIAQTHSGSASVLRLAGGSSGLRRDGGCCREVRCIAPA